MHKLFGASAVLFVLGACSPQPESEVNQAADLTPVVAEANLTNSTGSASVGKREAIDRDKVAAKEPPRSPAPAGAAPSYDVQAYCETVSDAVGGSYVIEKGCRDQEQEALAEIRGREIPARVARYCDEVAKAVGGSYVIFNGCVDQELGAAAEL